MIFPSKLAVHGDHRPVDVADQAVAKDDVGDFSIPALANIGQPAHGRDRSRFASRLAAKRLIDQSHQLDVGLSGRGRH